METLKNQRIWIVWRHETVSGRRTKVLYSVNGHKTGTSKKHAHTWASYDEALSVKKRHNFDGVGLVLPEGIGGIDLDGIKPESQVANDIRNLMNTYEELSPSQNGIHLLFKVDTTRLPVLKGKLSKEYYSKNPHNQMEIYFGGLTNRYLTFTGDVITDLPVEERTDEALAFLEAYMRRDLFKDSGNSSDLDDFDIIATARKAVNGEKFSVLFDLGDTSFYGSASEADQALCNILAFYTAGDKDQMDRIFKLSKLYRAKWDREDYKEATMDEAIKGCKGNFYTGAVPRPNFVIYNPRSKRMKINCPALTHYIRESLDYIFVKSTGKDSVLRYVYENGCYRHYSDNEFKGIIQKYITDYDPNILTMRDVNEVYQQIDTSLAFQITSDVNTDEDIINFKNGLLRLSDLKLIPHSPNVLSTIQLPADWTDAPKPTPVFDSFMETLTSGDQAIQKLLLEFMGVTLSNVNGHRMKKALFMVGPGDTGKSQLKRLMELILGTGNYVGIDLKEIESRFGTANIYNKRLSGSSDMSFVTVGELKTFKKCTGGDSIFAEFKGKDGFEFVYGGLFWFCMNKLPKFGGDDGQWVYDRIILVKCKNIIPAKEQDKFLLDKLYEEREGIIHKAVMALKDVIDKGYAFTEPDSVITARKAYREDNSTVISFLNECTEKRQDGKISDGCTTGKVYDVYKAWCNDNNHGFAKTAKDFREEVSEYFNEPYNDLITRRGKGGSFFKNFTLTDETKERYAKAYGYDPSEFLSEDQDAS